MRSLQWGFAASCAFTYSDAQFGSKQGSFSTLEDAGQQCGVWPLSEAGVDWQLSEEQLDEGVANPGNPAALGRVVAKLRAREPLSVVAIGGSVTIGHGLKKWENDAWPAVLQRGLNAKYPADNGAHVVINRGFPAKGTTYFKDILDKLLPPGTDLIVFEFAVNDKMESREGGELLPHSAGPDTEELVRAAHIHSGGAPMVYLEVAQTRQAFFTAEDLHSPVLKYYRIPQLSWRQAVHSGSLPDAQLAKLIPDKLHAGLTGHLQMAQMLLRWICTAQQRPGAMRAAPDWKLTKPLFISQSKLEQLLKPAVTTKTADSGQEEDFSAMEQGGWRWGTDDQRNEKYGWLATHSGGGEGIVFDIQARENGRIMLGYLISYSDMGMASVKITQGNLTWTQAENASCLGCQEDTSSTIRGLYLKQWRQKDKGSVYAARTFLLPGARAGRVRVTVLHLPGNGLGCKFKLLSLISK
jgi:hypothetical protein